jgi:hypothetical protein
LQALDHASRVNNWAQWSSHPLKVSIPVGAIVYFFNKEGRTHSKLLLEFCMFLLIFYLTGIKKKAMNQQSNNNQTQLTLSWSKGLPESELFLSSLK